MPRRRALLASLAAATASLAGCSQTSDASTPQSTATTTDTTTEQTPTRTTTTTTTTETTTTTRTTTTEAKPADHPVAEGLADEPTLGPDPWGADAALVAFSDPSCPYCREFETDTFWKLRDDYIESGDLSFVYRNVPVVAAWGETAIHALEATYPRNEQAFWKLREHMYDNPSRFEESPASAAADFLDEKTSFENPGVVETEASKQARSDAVSEDERVMEACGLGGVPGFVFVRQGEVVTKMAGAISYTTAQGILDL